MAVDQKKYVVGCKLNKTSSLGRQISSLWNKSDCCILPASHSYIGYRNPKFHIHIITSSKRLKVVERNDNKKNLHVSTC